MRADELPAMINRGSRVLIGVVASATLLAGCGTPPVPTPSAPASASRERGPIVLAIGPDQSGIWRQLIEGWNTAHPQEPVTLRELSADPDQRHATLTASARAGSGEFTVMALDPVWIPEFASNAWIAKLAASDFPTGHLLAASVAGGTHQDGQYGYPVVADAGVLFYRKDLLAAAGVEVPKTWAALTAACGRVLAQQRSGVSCYGMGLHKSESLTLNVAEAVASAGGELAGAGGPGLDSPGASAGVKWLSDAASTATIPAAALNWQESQNVQAFAGGELVFARAGSAAWSNTQANGTNSKVVGKVGVSQLPGRAGPGVSMIGGLELALSANARNQVSAADLVRWLASEPVQRQLVEKGALAPVLESLYADAGLAKQQPYLPTFAAAIKTAKQLPRSARYPELSAAVQESVYPVLQGKAGADKALPELQKKLTELLK